MAKHYYWLNPPYTSFDWSLMSKWIEPSKPDCVGFTYGIDWAATEASVVAAAAKKAKEKMEAKDKAYFTILVDQGNGRLETVNNGKAYYSEEGALQDAQTFSKQIGRTYVVTKVVARCEYVSPVQTTRLK